MAAPCNSELPSEASSCLKIPKSEVLSPPSPGLSDGNHSLSNPSTPSRSSPLSAGVTGSGAAPAGLSGASPSVSFSTACRGMSWTPAETNALIAVWGNERLVEARYQQLEGAGTIFGTKAPGPAMYDRVSRALAELGYERTPSQCRERMKTLRRCYSRVKERGVGKRKSSYTFEQLERVFGQGGWDTQPCQPVLINSSGLYQEMESDGSTMEDYSQEDWGNHSQEIQGFPGEDMGVEKANISYVTPTPYRNAGEPHKLGETHCGVFSGGNEAVEEIGKRSEEPAPWVVQKQPVPCPPNDGNNFLIGGGSTSSTSGVQGTPGLAVGSRSQRLNPQRSAIYEEINVPKRPPKNTEPVEDLQKRDILQTIMHILESVQLKWELFQSWTDFSRLHLSNKLAIFGIGYNTRWKEDIRYHYAEISSQVPLGKRLREYFNPEKPEGRVVMTRVQKMNWKNVYYKFLEITISEARCLELHMETDWIPIAHSKPIGGDIVQYLLPGGIPKCPGLYAIGYEEMRNKSDNAVVDLVNDSNCESPTGLASKSDPVTPKINYCYLGIAESITLQQCLFFHFQSTIKNQSKEWASINGFLAQNCKVEPGVSPKTIYIKFVEVERDFLSAGSLVECLEKAIGYPLKFNK